MDVKIQFGSGPSELHHDKWDVAFIGNSIDERGEKATEYLIENSISSIVVEYFPREFKVKFDLKILDKDDVEDVLKLYIDKTIVIDSTTLYFSELLILLQAFKDLGAEKISVLYLEPNDYKRKSKKEDLLHFRDFELSESIVGYEAIPGHALIISSDLIQRMVFLCGYEAERIDRALEDSEILTSKCSCIFGVPSISPGWEIDSFDNNISIIKERRITGGINFCSATNPYQVLSTLNQIYQGLEEEEEMFVVPLATKPMNLGACLFLLDKPKNKVAVMYDHPKEISGRAINVGNWHLFNIIF